MSDRAMIKLGDCVEWMKRLKPDSIDAVVTDPPYELGFMGKSWDRSGIAFAPATWREVLRVLKPGGHLLAFGGTRTSHRIAVAIEDAGFEIRDSIDWIYGQGFPKSLDVSKAIDAAAGATREPTGKEPRRPNPRAMMPGGDGLRTCDASTRYDAPATIEAAAWDGWGTALKPAHEPIVLARKALIGTVAANVLAHGTGGLNVDGCRVEGVKDVPVSAAKDRIGQIAKGDEIGRTMDTSGFDPCVGRWPPNVLLSHDPRCNGTCAPGCPVAMMDTQSGSTKSTSRPRFNKARVEVFFGQTDKIDRVTAGGATRFFPIFEWSEFDFLYCAKASRSDRGKGNKHPTVKPVALMRWLVKLVTPPNGVVLDPFLGSGTTAVAALREGFRVIGFEKDDNYLKIAEDRIGSVG